MAEPFQFFTPQGPAPLSGIALATQSINQAGAYMTQATIEAGRAIKEGLLAGAEMHARNEAEKARAKQQAEQARIQGEILSTVADPGSMQEGSYRLVDDPQFLFLQKDPMGPGFLAEPIARQSAVNFLRQKGWSDEDAARGANDLFRERTARYLDDKNFAAKLGAYASVGGNVSDLQGALNAMGLDGHVGKQSVLELRTKDAADFWRSSPRYAEEAEARQVASSMQADTQTEVRRLFTETRQVATPLGVNVPIQVPVGFARVKPGRLVSDVASMVREVGAAAGLDEETVLSALDQLADPIDVQVVGAERFDAAVQALGDPRNGSFALNPKEAAAELGRQKVFRTTDDLREWARDYATSVLRTTTTIGQVQRGSTPPIVLTATEELSRLTSRSGGKVASGIPAGQLRSITIANQTAMAGFAGGGVENLKLYAGADGKVHVADPKAKALESPEVGIADDPILYAELVIRQAGGSVKDYSPQMIDQIRQLPGFQELVQRVTAGQSQGPAPIQFQPQVPYTPPPSNQAPVTGDTLRSRMKKFIGGAGK